MEQRNRSRKPKTKTFTGCWTCRSRKVKCDLARPQCNRCAKSRLACQGYAVPLYWITEDETSSTAFKRQARSVPLGNPHWPPGDVQDIDLHLHHVDTFTLSIESPADAPVETHGPTDFCSGPFGVFFLGVPPSPSSDLDSIESLEEAADGTDQLVLHSAVATVVTAATTGFSSSPSRLKSFSISVLLSQLPHALDASIQSDLLVQRLLHHYARNISSLLQPVLHSRNAYSSIYANQALAVAKTAPWRTNPDNSTAMTTMTTMTTPTKTMSAHFWNSRVALMYSLLAISSFHLRGSRGRPGSADAMARYFRMNAVTHLRTALESLESLRFLGSGLSVSHVPHYEAVLMVVLTLITADVMDGHMDEFWIHLHATQDLVVHLHDEAQPGSAAEHLINISRFLRILSDSTDIHLPPVPWSPDEDGSAVFLGGGHSLEFTYGITATLASLLSRVCLLARNAAYYRDRGRRNPPAGFLQACRQFLDDVGAWHISSETLTSFRSSDAVTVLLVAKHMNAFAAAIQIYFYARVAVDLDNTINVDNSTGTVAALVRRVAADLTDMERIKAQTSYATTPTASITWPGFIASCQLAAMRPGEPALQRTWEAWWQQMLAYSIGNVESLWEVVQEAWASSDQDGAGPGMQWDDAPWVAVLRRRRRRILAI